MKEDRHYTLFTPEHLVNHLKKAGFKKVKTNFIKESDNFFISLIDRILMFTPFKRMGFKKISAVGIK